MASATLTNAPLPDKLPDCEITLKLNRKEALTVMALVSLVGTHGGVENSAYDYAGNIYDALCKFEDHLSKEHVHRCKFFEQQVIYALCHNEFVG